MLPDERRTFLESSLPGAEYLPELSDAEHAIVKHNGRTILAVRGTDIKNTHGGRYADLATDVLVTLGLESISPRYRRSEEKLKIVRETMPDVVLAGHSLGGSIARHLGTREGIESHAFNPGTTYAQGKTRGVQALIADRSRARELSNVYLTAPSVGKGVDVLSVSGFHDPLSTVHVVRQKDLPDDKKGVLGPHSIHHFV